MASRRSRPELQPAKLGRGQGKYWDPFYQFEQLARYHGEPPEPQPSKRAVLLVRMLTSRALAIVMGVVLAAVLLVLLVLLVFRG